MSTSMFPAFWKASKGQWFGTVIVCLSVGFSCWFVKSFVKFPIAKEAGEGDAGELTNTTWTNITLTNTARYLKEQRPERGAICLVGAARDFELTGPSIKEHLLSAYPNADVFVNMVLDHKTHTVTLLKDVPNLSRILVTPQWPWLEKEAHRNVLSGADSPKGIQGLLHYFKLVEGCLDLIDNFRKEHSVEYTWIIRTRVDTFWDGPPPVLSVKQNTYVVPEGSRYHGFNDRFGFGGFYESRVALSRLSLLEKLNVKKKMSLNSESAFKQQLSLYGIKAVEIDVNFCVLTRRVHHITLSQWAVPIVALSSEGPKNGAKCAPCTPASGNMTWNREMMNQYIRGWSWPGKNPNLKLCLVNETWEAGWEAIYDQLVGSNYSTVREDMKGRSFDSCVKEFTELQSLPGVYIGPPAEVVCRIGSWGQHTVIGKSRVPVHLDALNSSSIVYSVQFGDDVLLEELQERTNSTVVAVHIKLSGSNANQYLSGLLKGIILKDWTFSLELDHVEHRLLPSSSFTSPSDPLETTIRKMGSNRTDLLMLAVNNNTLTTITDVLSQTTESNPICQLVLCLEPMFTGSLVLSIFGTVRQAVEKLSFTLVHCTGMFGQENCVFVKTSFC